MKYPAIAEAIIELKDEDLALRAQLIKTGQLGDDYNATMEALHNLNADRLDTIIDTLGYPTIDQIGEEATQATWLIIQHSIGKPDFMKKCKRLLTEAVAKGIGSAVHLAYLSDRIAIYEGKPQQNGTGYDWDENGELSPNEYDDLALVNERRRNLGLNTLEEQTALMRAQAEEDNHSPPVDQHLRTKKFENWKRKVGWTNKINSMNQFRDNGAIGALLDEYEKAVDEMKEVIAKSSTSDLFEVVDKQTADKDCESIQSILTHVVSAGYNYVVAIRGGLGEAVELKEKMLCTSVAAYSSALDKMFAYNVQLFEDHPTLQLEEYDPEKKIKVRWGQLYDPDQLLEHAIVHVLRHRRQIERFQLKLSS